MPHHPDYGRLARTSITTLQIPEGARAANACDVTQSAVSQWIGDVLPAYRRNPDTLDQYESLARALRMNPADMLYGIDVEDVELYRKITWLTPGQRAAVATIIASMLQGHENQETA